VLGLGVATLVITTIEDDDDDDYVR